jgi:hypothetical protein
VGEVAAAGNPYDQHTTELWRTYGGIVEKRLELHMNFI